jgi:hypothetical protein
VASHAAIAAITGAVVALLEAAATDAQLAGIRCSAYRGGDLAAPMDSGVSVYLHRVDLDTTARNAPGPGAGPATARVALGLHYLLTAWDPDPARQQRILGWAISALQATPVLTAGFLNADGEPIFDDSETVTLTWEKVAASELAAIWTVAPASQQPSVAFVARLELGSA